MKRLVFLFLALIPLIFAGCGAADAELPLFSFETGPGIYKSRFKLGLIINDPGIEVRYTLDSSVPTAESKLYDDEGIDIA